MRHLLIVILFFVTSFQVFAAENLTVLKDQDGVAPGKVLEFYLRKQFYKHLDDRRGALESLKTRADCEKWQKERREFFIRQLGGFPKRKPLNAQVVGKLDGEGYRVEKVLFESRPGHHVSANFYLPKSKGPFPGVIIPCGHSHNGKASGQYQRMAILLAKNGMAALCYDPVGQGERYQMLDYEKDHPYFVTRSNLATPHPRVQYLCTTEHTIMGVGSILLGANIAQYRVWDGMRAIDYLQSRDDIDAEKIGCVGQSGGGTLTSYLMALDDRIVAAAPACYLTTFRKLIENKGAQDGEQNIFGQIAFGMDEPDYVMMRAPKPTLICAGRRDSTFPIEGTWDLFRQSKRFYTTLGYPERVDLNDADLPHSFVHPQREAAARWMHRWLLGEDKVIFEFDRDSLPDPISDEKMRELSQGDWSQEELYCSPEGQVLLMKGEKSVFQLNAEQEQELRKQRSKVWMNLSDDQRRDLVRKTIGSGSSDHKRDALDGKKIIKGEQIQRRGYLIEKLILNVGLGIPLPALAFVPSNPNGQVTLYLHGDSMKADAAPGGPIEELIEQGQIVLAAELRGIGETGPGPDRDRRDFGRGAFGGDVQNIFLAYLIGRSHVGMRVDDITEWTSFLEKYRTADDQSRKLNLVAVGEAAIPALHAAALQPDVFQSIKLKNMIRSWSEVVSYPNNHNQLVNVVHGALKYYDLPDLVGLAGEEKISMDESVDVMGKLLPE